MKVKVLLFGKLQDLAQTKMIELEDVTNTDSLFSALNKANLNIPQQGITVAVNQNIVQNNTPLQDGDTIALMPPFAGG